MSGDITRNTFRPEKHYSSVRMQQGRVQLDSDSREETDIVNYFLRQLAADLIGPHAGPHGNVGFKIGPGNLAEEGFTIGAGRYYVNGILCENKEELDENNQPIPVTYYTQKDYPNPAELPGPPFLVYLDVWGRHITYIQDPEIREVALNGLDTSTREQIISQVKVEPDISFTSCPTDDEWSSLVEKWQPQNRGMLKAGTVEFEVDDSIEPCTVSPESKYRGAENQLYRVEIHRSGPAGTATFKWSREAGCIDLSILQSSGEEFTLEHLGRDDRFSLHEGDWVEVVDDETTLRGEVYPLLQVKSIDRDRMVVTLEVPVEVELPVYDQTTTSHPLLRRWDHKKLDPTLGYPVMADDGALQLEEGNWLKLENGIQIYFEAALEQMIHMYRSGDYWLIAARTATGDVEWPGPKDDPVSRPPHGIYHSYAPLAVLVGRGAVVTDCRREIKELWTSLST